MGSRIIHPNEGMQLLYKSLSSLACDFEQLPEQERYRLAKVCLNGFKSAQKTDFMVGGPGMRCALGIRFPETGAFYVLVGAYQPLLDVYTEIGLMGAKNQAFENEVAQRKQNFMEEQNQRRQALELESIKGQQLSPTAAERQIFDLERAFEKEIFEDAQKLINHQLTQFEERIGGMEDIFAINLRILGELKSDSPT
ncbi:MAG: hypothetical protein ACFCA4_12695 [Cyanophyceae cyanobacterium]